MLTTGPEGAAPTRGAMQPRPLSGRVLVVDDSRMQLRLTSSLLTNAGLEVEAVETAAEALEVCRTRPVGMILSDWMMPGMDGLALCREVRALNLDRYIYFILLTSKGEKDEVARGLDAGADDFLTKPVNAGELRARIMAGQRILDMHRELQTKNQLVESTLHELQRVYDAIDRDLLEARKLQHSLIRQPLQRLPAADIHLFLESCGRVGGDLVGSYPISADRIGIYGIDVSGHGIASALMTARLAGFLSSTAPDQNVALAATAEGRASLSPAEVVSRLNTLFLDEIETEHYFTICLAEVDLTTGEAIFCQAGHPHPVVHRADGSVEYLGDGGFPVGLVSSATYAETRFRLSAGDRFLIYSDGVTECAQSGGGMLGEDGLASILHAAAQEPDLDFFDVLSDQLEDFAGDLDLGDDISAVLLEFRG